MELLRPYLQLVRLPNVFTALADILLGWLAVDPERTQLPGLIGLLAASACLYMAGMVFNDFFDLEQDRRERPFRPLPSGRVSRRAAGVLGAALLAAGTLAAALVSGTSLVVALGLVSAILLYDGGLKRTWAGPLAMGGCRLANVLLGVSVAGRLAGVGWHLALVVGIYIVGVTGFARTEARQSERFGLLAAALTILAGLLLALPLPVWVEPGTSSPLFPYLLVALGFWIGVPVWQAIEDPGPEPVQFAVRRAIFSLVGLDAVLATALVGSVGLGILLLLVPIVLLGRVRWLYAT
jgi:4-hydroxybenzoate polyprenyltransferase